MKARILISAALLAVAASWAMPAAADSPEACRKRCEAIQDSIEHPTQSGATVNAYEACMEGCAALESAMNEFKRCIAAAKTEEAKQACRDAYMENRP
ncbi:MAG: hypothetical protein R3D02_06060 [Hyphomicrobiales bacterium]